MAKQRAVHDGNKRKDASVTKKGQGPVVPDHHWQMDVGKSVFVRGYGNDPAGAFLPHPGKERAQPHIKINECDH